MKIKSPPIPLDGTDPGVGGFNGYGTLMVILYALIIVSLTFSILSQLSNGDIGVDLGDQICLQSQEYPFAEPKCYDIVEVYNK